MQEKFEIINIEHNEDIHNHTKGSDGAQSTLRLLLRAGANKRNIVSMADHDSVRGYRNLEREIYSVVNNIRADKSYNPSKLLEVLQNVKLLKGTELITSYNGVIVEVLGYNFNLDKMEAEIEKLKEKRQQPPYEALYEGFVKIIEEKGLVFNKEVLDEAFEKIKRENKGGVVGPFFNELIAHEENKELLKYVDENGEEQIADTLKLFINKHLYNKKSELFVDMSKTRPSFEDTIEAIHRAGGKAFLAHAGRYKDKFDVESSIDDMIEKGLDGLEVFYPDHSYEFRQFLLEKVKEHNLLASGGTDDHHKKSEGIQYQMGKVAIPDIPETEWIKQSAINDLDFISNSEIMKNAINELRIIKEHREKQNYDEIDQR